MQFINPSFLLALFSVLIPIAIHLFNFRKYRKVYFSNVQFLKDLQQKTQKQSQLLHLLVLLLRIIAIAMLVLAFAQPFIPSAIRTSPGKVRLVSVFVDNSFSMEATGKQGRLLDEARKKASEIAAAYRPDDLFQLLTNDFEGKHQRLVSRDEFLEMLPDIQLTSSNRSLKQILERQHDLLITHRSADKASFIISDFQKSTIMANEAGGPADVRCFLVPLSAGKTGNLYIDSCWFENPVIQLNRSARLQVKLRNASDANLEKIPVRLLIENQQRAVASVDIAANSDAITELTFSNPEAGFKDGEVSINDYPVTYDDNYFFAFNIADHISILSVSDATTGAYLNSVFSLDSIFTSTEMQAGRVDYSTLGNYQLIVLNGLNEISSGAIQEYSSFVKLGGTLMVFPPENEDASLLNPLLAALGSPTFGQADETRVKVSEINTKDPVFSDVFEKSGLDRDHADLPVINRHYKLEGAAINIERLISLANGDPMLITLPSGQGKIYLSAVSAGDNDSNFPRHAIFVPCMLNIAFRSEESIPMSYAVDIARGISAGKLPPAADNLFSIVRSDGTESFIPEYRRIGSNSLLFINHQLKEAGNYRVMSGNHVSTVLAFNYDRRESDLQCADIQELNRLTEKNNNFEVIETGQKPLANTLQTLYGGRKLWKWFLLAALVSLAGEIILLRFFRKTKINNGNTGA